MGQTRFTVGIDLGTTNSAVAYVDTAAEIVEGDPIRTFVIQQLVNPGAVEGRSLLPSSLFFPSGHEMPPGSTALPWDPKREHVVGYLARALGAHVPGRLVHSAKSWLCNPDVDRRAPILPWAATEEVPRLSPVQASAEYLEYMREAWNFQVARSKEDRLERQEVFLTVPASFDTVARQLTLEAAKEAGLANVTLLEEPQAAFYCWIGTHQARWREVLGHGQVILICDVGGGTSDFTLILVEGGAKDKKEPTPVRVAVGDHLLLGGDNMDLALAHRLEPRLFGKKRLPAWEWGELVHACREAKETILRKAGVEKVPVSILGRSSKVVGGTMTCYLTREELIEQVTEGFFPACGLDEAPAEERSGGLAELGLPYAADPSITRHLATFLRESAPAVRERLPEAIVGDLARPDVILFNGGVFRPAILRERLLEVVRSWFPQDPAWTLSGVVNGSPDLSVARGAAYYGLVRRGYGIRIVGGAARAYYLGLGDSGLGQVGKAVCVVQRGMEEGDAVDVTGRRFSLTLGQAVRFPLFSSSVRIRDQVGDVLDRNARGLVALPSLRTVLEQGELSRNVVEVGLCARLTETGTLELSCQPPTKDRSWKLELELRAGKECETPVIEVSATGQRSPQILETAQKLVKAVYSPKARTASGLPKDPAGLRKRLEETLAARRELWLPRTLRELFEALSDVEDGRFASALHESRWLNLAGFCIRPGLGYPKDGARIRKLWALFGQDLRFKRDEENHREWWILWRRAAGGLDIKQQSSLFERISPQLLPSQQKSRQGPKEAERPGVLQEMWRLAASLEWVEPGLKVQLGETLLSGLSPSQAPPYSFWALARLGARWPVSGTVSHVVPHDVVEGWVRRLVKLLRAHGDRVSFTLAHMARLTGDRSRDLDEGLRRELLARLTEAGAPERHRQLVGDIVQLAESERGTLLGDSIPPGLQLLDSPETSSSD